MTESDKLAQAKYKKNKVRRIELRFYPKDADLYEHAKSLGSGKIKDLIEKDRLKK